MLFLLQFLLLLLLLQPPAPAPVAVDLEKRELHRRIFGWICDKINELGDTISDKFGEFKDKFGDAWDTIKNEIADPGDKTFDNEFSVPAPPAKFRIFLLTL